MNSRLDSPLFKAQVIIRLCGALFLGCLGLYELVKGGSALLQLNQFRSNSIPIEATSHTGRESGYPNITFQYVANGMRLSETQNVSKEFYTQHRSGSLTVYYDRNQPSIAFIDLDHLYGVRRDEILFGGGAMIFCVLMFSFWYWMYFGRNQ